MAILAIDPGPQKSAWVRLTCDGEIDKFGDISNEELYDVIAWVADAPVVNHFAIEMICSYGMSVGASVFETCTWIGKYELWAKIQGITQIHRITRMQVKMACCHDSRAKDKNIRQAMIDRWGAQGTKKNPGPTYGMSGDVWAALAVATTYLSQVDPQQQKLLF